MVAASVSCRCCQQRPFASQFFGPLPSEASVSELGQKLFLTTLHQVHIIQITEAAIIVQVRCLTPFHCLSCVLSGGLVGGLTFGCISFRRLRRQNRGSDLQTEPRQALRLQPLCGLSQFDGNTSIRCGIPWLQPWICTLSCGQTATATPFHTGIGWMRWCAMWCEIFGMMFSFGG